MVNFQQTFVISNPGNVANAWEGELYCVPDPTMPMSHYTREGATGAYAMDPNTTLGATIGAAITSWSTSFEKWRLAYYGVTVYLDAPALANQGSVVACQYPCIPTIQSLTGPATQVGLATPSHLVVRYQAEDTPSYETIMQMPNSYSGQFKEGLYLPLKLDSNHAQWRTQNDLVFDGTGFAAPNANNRIVPILPADVGGLYPGTTGIYYDPNTDLFGGATHYLPAINNLGAIAFQGISGQASVRVVVRMGYECMVQPGTAYTSFIKVSPAFDPVAITSYFMISRQLKDAYPAEYNDLGKLWEIIKKAAGYIAPFISLLPGGSMAVAAGRLVGKGIDALAKSKQAASKKANVRSATQRAEMVMQQAMNVERAAERSLNTANRIVAATATAAQRGRLSIQRPKPRSANAYN
jgi:hypothetical protein